MEAGAEFYLVEIEKPIVSDEPVKTEGGVFIPYESEDPAATSAKVIAVGDFTTSDAKVGNTIYFNKFAAQLVKDNIYAIADKQILASE